MVQITEMGLMQAYEVLEVSEGQTLAEIKRAYRVLMRRHHPDVTGNNPNDVEKTKLVARAWEVVQAWHVDPVPQEEPAPVRITESEIKVGNFYCKLYAVEAGSFWGVETDYTLHLPLAYFDQNPDLRMGLRLYDNEGNRLYRVHIKIIDDMKNVVFECSDSWALERSYLRYQRELKAQGLKHGLSALHARLDEVPVAKKPAAHPVFRHLRECDTGIETYVEHGSSYRKSASTKFSELQVLLRQIEREIEELECSDALEIAVDYVMKSSHLMVHQANLNAAANINVAAIRTGGFIDRFGEAELRSFYYSALKGSENPLRQAQNELPILHVEDFAPADVLADPDLEVAPNTVTLSGNRGETEYRVTYRFDDEGPLAIVRLPLKVYKHHAPEYGRPATLPVLPHGIRWAVEIVFDGRVVVSGLLSLELNKKLEKWERGRGRAKHAEQWGTIGDDLYGHEVSTVPWWYAGANKPGRRR